MRIKAMELPALALEAHDGRCHHRLGRRAISVLLKSGRSSLPSRPLDGGNRRPSARVPQPHMQEAEAYSFTGLEGLLGGQEPHATLHDACLLDIAVNYDARVLSAHIEVCVGDPESTIEQVRERRRLGQLSLNGLKLWCIDPPSPESGQLGPLWLTDEGPLSDAPTKTGRELGAAVASHEAAGYLYFSSLNCFAYYRAESATFAWV